MKTWALALLLLTACQSHPPPESPEVTAKRAVVHLGFAGGSCSGTMISPTKLLSASHCWDNNDTLLTVNMAPVNVTGIQHDGADHALVTLDTPQAHWVAVGPAPKQGDRLFMYGNPQGLRDFYREGYVAGFTDAGTFLDMTAGRGDSGAGIFNEQGQLVGVLSAIAQAEPFHMAIARPFADGFPAP